MPKTTATVKKKRQLAPPRRSKAPTLRVRTLGDLTPDPDNARQHTPRNIDAIAESIATAGLGRSIVVDERGVILAGNGTVDAAAERGLTKVLEVTTDGKVLIAVRRSGLTEAQKRVLAITDNRANELSEWNKAKLLEQLQALSGGDAALLERLGFLPSDLTKLAPSHEGLAGLGVTPKAPGVETCPRCGGTAIEALV